MGNVTYLKVVTTNVILTSLFISRKLEEVFFLKGTIYFLFK